MPEDLLTPTEGIQQLRKQEALREQQRLEPERQPSLFPAHDPEPGEDE